MARITHRITANADTVIILRNPNAEFTPWSLVEAEISPETSSTGSGPSEPTIDASTEDLNVDEVVVGEVTVNRSELHEAAINGTTSGNEASNDAAQEFATKVALAADISNEAEIANDCIAGDEIWYYVSRSHLTSCSPVFENMLSTKWKGRHLDESDKLIHVTAENWDSDALLHFFQIIHHRNRQVPRTVSLDMLAKVTVLNDFYGCSEAMELWTDRWVEDLRMTSPIPSFLCRNLILWMCVSWVLRLPKEFAETIAIAISQEDEDIPTLGLPIVTCIEKIKEFRRQRIGIVFSQLQDLLQGFRSPLYECPHGDSFECGSILYGALIREMERQGLLPIPTDPYSGVKISELRTKINGIRSPAWCRPNRYKSRSQHNCDLSEKVKIIADSVNRLDNGPKIEDFESC